MAATLESRHAARDDATHPTGQPRAAKPLLRTDPDLSNHAHERAESHALTARIALPCPEAAVFLPCGELQIAPRRPVARVHRNARVVPNAISFKFALFHAG